MEGNNIKNANINLREIANFWKCAKIYTRKNIYVHSIFHLLGLALGLLSVSGPLSFFLYQHVGIWARLGSNALGAQREGQTHENSRSGGI